MRFANGNTIALALLAGAGMAGAHMKAGTLSIKSGQTFNAGQLLTLTWEITVTHTNQGGVNIDYSPDGGNTWNPVKTGLTDVSGVNTYNWTVPNQETAHGKLRVCQPAGASCTSVTADRPSTSAPYALVSPEFTIASTSAIVPIHDNAYALGYDTKAGTITVSFELIQSDGVLLQAFDIQGRLKATLLAGNFEGGAHRLILNARSLAPTQALVFKLHLGKSIRTQAWIRK